MEPSLFPVCERPAFEIVGDDIPHGRDIRRGSRVSTGGLRQEGAGDQQDTQDGSERECGVGVHGKIPLSYGLHGR